MGGMGGGPGTNDPTVVAAFHHALLRGGLVVAVLALLVFVVWRRCVKAELQRGLSAARPPDNRATGSAPAKEPAGDQAPGTSELPASEPAGDTVRGLRPAEPAGRRLLRVGFGLLWLFDGVLQGQASIPLGLVPRVVRPAAATSPAWVRHLVDSGASVWTYHPVTAAASAVWIQVGIGLLLLVSGYGTWSRLAGVASAAWGLVVWVFGEAFGGIFAPGLTWLFGAPGAGLLYVAGGVLLALPLSLWRSPASGRWLLRGAGGFFVGMALLQAWPGRGFWQGQSAGNGSTGALTGMVRDMARTPQPHLLASMVRAFAGFDAAHGWAVNLFAVVALAATGAAMASGHRVAVSIGVVGAAVLCLADWVLVEDLGFLGGVGTDPNSMIPMLLLLASGYLALARVPAVVAEPAEQQVPPWRQRLAAEPVYALRAAAAVAALGVTLVGVAPMAVATAEVVGGTQTTGRHALPLQTGGTATPPPARSTSGPG